MAKWIETKKGNLINLDRVCGIFKRKSDALGKVNYNVLFDSGKEDEYLCVGKF